MSSVGVDKDSRRVSIVAASAFLKVEVVAYLVLGFLLAWSPCSACSAPSPRCGTR